MNEELHFFEHLMHEVQHEKIHLSLEKMYETQVVFHILPEVHEEESILLGQKLEVLEQ